MKPSLALLKLHRAERIVDDSELMRRFADECGDMIEIDADVPLVKIGCEPHTAEYFGIDGKIVRKDND